MADALVSPAVAGVAGMAAVGLIVTASKKIRSGTDESVVPLMGVMGAFIFAAQMINFAIPGTGSSGHIVGGILLGALLGPWAGFLTLSSVLVVQCLIFADGGLMALGCNILNMAAVSTLVAYPFVYRPIAGEGLKTWRIMTAAVVASVVGLELGACLVTAETELSGVTALPWKSFFALMCSIHFFIGIGEGIATAAVLYFVRKYRPDLFAGHHEAKDGKRSYKKAVWVFLGLAVLVGGVLSFVASSNPDGLEWSIQSITGLPELASSSGALGEAFDSVQKTTSFLPDYESSWSGIIGCAIVVALVWVVACVITRRRTSVNKI